MEKGKPKVKLNRGFGSKVLVRSHRWEARGIGSQTVVYRGPARTPTDMDLGKERCIWRSPSACRTKWVSKTLHEFDESIDVGPDHVQAAAPEIGGADVYAEACAQFVCIPHSRSGQ